jgi:hypothetical protein
MKQNEFKKMLSDINYTIDYNYTFSLDDNLINYINIYYYLLNVYN